MNKMKEILILSMAIALILISPVLSQTYDDPSFSSELLIVDFREFDPVPYNQYL